MIVIRVDPQTNIVTYDEPSSDTLKYEAASFREAIDKAVEVLQMFGAIMDENGVKNFDLSKE